MCVVGEYVQEGHIEANSSESLENAVANVKGKCVQEGTVYVHKRRRRFVSGEKCHARACTHKQCKKRGDAFCSSSSFSLDILAGETMSQAEREGLGLEE